MEITLRCQINRGVLINGGWKLFEEFNERGGLNKRGDLLREKGSLKKRGGQKLILT